MWDGMGADGTPTVMVVDDHPIWRDAVARDLAEDGFSVVATADGMAAARRRAAVVQPDVVLMDMRLSDGDGAQATAEVLAVSPSSRILVLSASDERDDVLQAVKAGATGYLVKSASKQELGDAVRATAEGRAVFTPGLAGLVLGEYRRIAQSGGTGPAGTPVPSLTERETEVLRHVAKGLTAKQIAAQAVVESPHRGEPRAGDVAQASGRQPCRAGAICDRTRPRRVVLLIRRPQGCCDHDGMTEPHHAVIARLSADFAAISQYMARVSTDLTALDGLLSARPAGVPAGVRPARGAVLRRNTTRSTQPPVPSRPPVTPQPPVPPRPPRERSEGWIGKVLAVAGVAVTLIGVVLLLVLAAQAGILRPEIRVGAGAALAGALVAAAGWLYARPGGRVGAIALAATGIAAAYMDVIAVTTIYEWVPAPIGLAIAAVIGGGGLTLARRWDSQHLGLLVLVPLIALAPVVTGGITLLLVGFMLALSAVSLIGAARQGLDLAACRAHRGAHASAPRGAGRGVLR